MELTTKTLSRAEIGSLEAAGRILRCAGQSTPSGLPRNARISDNVAEQAARRIGTMAILTAATAMVTPVLQQVLQPEMAAAQQTLLFRLSGLLVVFAGIGLAALQRTELVTPQDLLDLGLVFEIIGSCALALMENAMRWPNSPIRGSTGVAARIAICAVVIPNRPWKSVAAAIASALAVPCAHLVAAQIQGYPAMPWNRLLSYPLGALVAAGWTPFISIRIHRLQENLVRTQDLGSYHLERLLGRGGMGEVWLARHRSLRREAAVKLVAPGLLEHAGASERRHLRKHFESEARAIASLRSPHTVAIYDYGLAENGSLYYAMEYLAGLDAEALVNQYGPQPPGRIISLLRQVCESLEEAHEAGLVHRDIKPRNVFICRLGKRTDFVKVLDFGLAHQLPGATRTVLTTTTATGGTPAYMAPEQVRGEDCDSRTDIYAIGCLAYFLLTGTVVFRRPTAMAMAMAHLSEPPDHPSKRSELPIPQSLEQVVMACLQKRRQQRPQSVAELRSMLDACTEIIPWTEPDANRWWALHHPETVRMDPVEKIQP